MNIIAVTYGSTESGDDLEVLLWTWDPTNQEIDAEYKKLYPEEYGNGNGHAAPTDDGEEEDYAPGFVNWKKELRPAVLKR